MLNIFKKLLSSLISLILLLSITTICAIFVTRNLLSGENISNIIKSTININNDGTSNNYLNDLIENNNMEEYINIDELGSELSAIINDTLKYESGIPNSEQPNTDSLKEKIYEYAQRYEKETGEKVDYAEIDKGLEEFDTQLKQNYISNQNTQFKKIISIIYNNNYLYIVIFAAIVCLILLITLNKLEDLIKDIAFIAVFNGAGYYAFHYALNKIFSSNQNSTTIKIIDILTNIFNKIAIVSVCVAVILIIIYFIIKIVKKHKEKVAARSTNRYIEETIAKVTSNMK